MLKYHIKPEKTYVFPAEVSVVHYLDSILVIAPDTANWIVLNNDKCLEILESFRQGKTVKEISSEFRDNLSDVKTVVTQLEAKKFCTKVVSKVTDAPRSLHLYMTNRCNLHCPHCYMFSGAKEDKELSTNEIVRLFHDYKIFGGKNVTLSGGEPTLRDDFDTLVREAYDVGLKVRVLTNGSLLTAARVAAVTPYLDSIQISIDGFSEESNSIIRGTGHFDKAMNAVTSFVNGGVNTSVAITPSLDLLRTHLNEYSLFAENLVRKIPNKNFVVKFSENLLKGRDICPSEQGNDEYYRLIKALRRNLNGSKFEIMSFVHSLNGNTIMDNCMFGVFAVSSNGDVFLCARTNDLKPVANIRKQSFSEIIRLSDMAVKASLIMNLRPCNTCELRYICGGGCRIDEFRSLVCRASFDNIDYDAIPPRQCRQEYKNTFYRLMIESNPYLYSEVIE